MNDTHPAAGNPWCLSRRTFCGVLTGTLVNALLLPPFLRAQLREIEPREDLFAFMNRRAGRFDRTLYQQLIGAANDFKEGDWCLEKSRHRSQYHPGRFRNIGHHPQTGSCSGRNGATDSRSHGEGEFPPISSISFVRSRIRSRSRAAFSNSNSFAACFISSFNFRMTTGSSFSEA
jgi:hypothetical protein